MKNLPMLMSLYAERKDLYSKVKNYYIVEQLKFGRKLKQIEKDFNQLTCMGTCTIVSCINIDNTNEGRAYWKSIETEFKSIYQ